MREKQLWFSPLAGKITAASWNTFFCLLKYLYSCIYININTAFNIIMQFECTTQNSVVYTTISYTRQKFVSSTLGNNWCTIMNEKYKKYFKDPIMNHCWKDHFDVLYAFRICLNIILISPENWFAVTYFTSYGPFAKDLQRIPQRVVNTIVTIDVILTKPIAAVFSTGETQLSTHY